ncbi:MAG: alginate lyase family protein [Cytophagales bacterium]|nr:alginate lyase family protein [Cytophagales bacterium]
MKKATTLLLLCISIQLTAQSPLFEKVERVVKSRIITEANRNLMEKPVTVTRFQSERSAGGKHDFFSEGDYWWPDPVNPTGPYIQKDGLTNPGNFTAHRKAMIRFSQIVANQTSAYLISGRTEYAKHAINHIKAWMVDTTTMMSPHLLYAQAIKGKVTGRGVGIIDMIQLIEVAKSIEILEKRQQINEADRLQIHAWFTNYLRWVTTHSYGKEEREAKNNHGTCWVMQVSAFAHLVNDEVLFNYCKDRFLNVILPNQMDERGAFPLELKRTKPYGYSLFNLDAVMTTAHIFKIKNASLKKGIDFLYPYVKDKKSWPFPQDVMYWEEWPVAAPFLLFGYQDYAYARWFSTWEKLNHFPENEEVIRNLPIRNPLIWLVD